eukprot:1400507-Amphidinium_carterae.2
MVTPIRPMMVDALMRGLPQLRALPIIRHNKGVYHAKSCTATSYTASRFLMSTSPEQHQHQQRMSSAHTFIHDSNARR